MEININKKQIAQYALLPQVLPRFHSLISSGFSNLAYFMALVYRATNILPDHHLYLKPNSIGKYTVQNVLTEAANHLSFDLKHIDQVIIFFALIAGIFILAFQFLFLLLAAFIKPAAAQGLPVGIGEFFKTPNPKEDIALHILDSVFGVPEIFGSQEPTETPFHQALHALFQIYSFGLLVVAVIILIYFIFAIIAETAQTGTPFGKRYNHVWAPIRLVVGIGLLVPMTFGLNAGQWITLYAAKFGSGFATTGWILFNETLNNTYISRNETVAQPKVPDLRDLSSFMMMAHACKHGYIDQTALTDNDIKAWIINDKNGGKSRELSSVNYVEAIEFSDGKDIYIRFGQKDDQFPDDIANVHPYCGDVVLVNPEPLVLVDNGTPTASVSGSMDVNIRYFILVQAMWYSDYQGMKTGAEDYIDRRITNKDTADPDPIIKKNIMEAAEKLIEDVLPRAVITAQNEIKKDDKFRELGWGSAALWYNEIANQNGKLTTAVFNKPQVKNLPATMKYTCEQNQQQNSKTNPKDCYSPNLSKGKKVQYLSKADENVAAALSDLFDYWYKDPEDQTGNAFIDVVNTILGTQGLFNMCENSDKHPLAQLSSLGKGMIEAAIRNLGISILGGAASILPTFFGPALSAASSFFATAASIGILIGFILFYVVPFLPFLYFLFAIGGWVKGLFEAMVGVPLWALAHLRIDGEGLPGDAAINGYFLIFEIFIRPILIIFGLLASVLIFAAMVRVLNTSFTLIISNLGGFEPGATAGICDAKTLRAVQEPGTIEWMRGPIDEFFFTIIYTIIVYMIGMSSFKLIDMIPNNILRWMGQGLQTFNDQRGESAEGLVSKIAIGGSIMSSNLQIAGNLKTGVGGVGKGLMDLASGGGPKAP